MSPKEHAKYYFPNEMTSDQRTRGMNENFVDFLVRHNFSKDIAMEISKKMNEEPFIVNIVEDFWFKESDLVATLMDELIVESKAAFGHNIIINRLDKEHLLELLKTTKHELRHSWREYDLQINPYIV